MGNDEYAKANHSYGLTTLLDRHARIGRNGAEFRFRGKGGKPYRAAVRDARLASIVKRCRDIPGQRLFQYIDDAGGYRSVTSTDVNRYLRSITGRPFTAKTFRTWTGTVSTAVLLANSEAPRSARFAKRTVVGAIENVAERLGNTPSVCRKSYVHPAVLSAYKNGSLARLRFRRSRPPRHDALSPEERAVVRLLKQRQRFFK